MIPDILLNSRFLVLLFSVIIIAAVIAPNGASAQGLKTPSYCASESSGPIVYFSPIFDLKFNQPVRFSSNG